MKIIMIDAFKPEYLRYAPYLSSLTQRYSWGELEMPLGFEGGMEIFFKGNSDILSFFYRSRDSSFGWAKKFSWMGKRAVELLINLRRLFEGKRLFRLPKIPLKRFFLFDTKIKKPSHKKRGIKYTYFGDLDRVGHKYGTKSNEMVEAIKEIDKKVSRMDFDVILSDHGMIDITKEIKVPLTPDCFIDSTMARYWKNKPKFNSKDGKWIKGRKEYGEHIFLANPGVFISPNFWQGKEKLKAMHGYDPKHKDMKGFYILRKKGVKKNMAVKELHSLLKPLNSLCK